MIQLETMKNTYRILLLILIGLLLPISISAKDYFKVLDNMMGCLTIPLIVFVRMPVALFDGYCQRAVSL